MTGWLTDLYPTTTTSCARVLLHKMPCLVAGPCPTPTSHLNCYMCHVAQEECLTCQNVSSITSHVPWYEAQAARTTACTPTQIRKAMNCLLRPAAPDAAWHRVTAISPVQGMMSLMMSRASLLGTSALWGSVSLVMGLASDAASQFCDHIHTRGHTQ